ncbi:hypothetical protein BJ875DRAFT_99463 [Amylocarpus encephaloides]|uniref:Uncharacterized protein n=1 Tax=Amylocarpus encephaloides TaxID=45428 RepID=A0A9P7YDS1_9HELO|nr:hypothetical protein BJ875DRAFT_99463 [Amylocarpus encephaloides]
METNQYSICVVRRCHGGRLCRWNWRCLVQASRRPRAGRIPFLKASRPGLFEVQTLVFGVSPALSLSFDKFACLLILASASQREQPIPIPITRNSTPANIGCPWRILPPLSRWEAIPYQRAGFQPHEGSGASTARLLARGEGKMHGVFAVILIRGSFFALL